MEIHLYPVYLIVGLSKVYRVGTLEIRVGCGKETLVFMCFQFISLWVYQKYAEWVFVGCGI
jgi:hypothetical protein